MILHPKFTRPRRHKIAPHPRFLRAVRGVSRTVQELEERTSVLLLSVVTPASPTAEGQLIEAVALPWFKIVDLILDEPDTIYKLNWRKWEELIAGAYRQEGFDVILTPRSNDRGRDIIASSKDLGNIRFFDQVKAYSPGHLVTAEEVRAMIGVLSLEPNVSKAVITTTSTFAPGVMKDPNIVKLMPYRLELKPREQLIEWLASIANKQSKIAESKNRP
jgi:restriction system protein